jgi:phasin family protein
MTEAMQASRAAVQLVPEEMSRIFGAMPMMPDLPVIIAAQQRNMEVYVAAGRVALDGIQTFASRQQELMERSFNELSERAQETMRLSSPEQRIMAQADLVKLAWQRAEANARELAGLLRRCNEEAASLINRRVIEAIDEFRSQMLAAAAPA